MNQPIISIIVPIYNVEKELPRCLESLITQTFKDIEIICVIDGSPDNSLRICEEYKTNEPRMVIISQENQGLSGARNTGLAYSKGKYIQFCDPDDYYVPDMCEKLYNAVISSNADLAIASIRVLYDQIPVIAGDQEYYRVKNRGLTVVNEYVIRNTDVSACNKIFKKSIIDTYSIFFPQGLHYEDACFFYKYIFVSKTIYHIPEYLYVYVRRDNSIMSNTFQKTPRSIDHIKILKNIKEFLLKNNLRNSYETDVFLWMTIIYTHLAFSWGTESVYDSAIKIVSDLLADIPDIYIQSCPYVSKEEINKLMALKNNDKKLFLNIKVVEPRYKQLKNILLLFLPVGTKRRKYLKKIYHRLRGFK